ncbi:hypothetical protein BUE76_07520 [Cnuella takakiae]|nr:hypothetical protein BUE76_07520 [Cnuella takakiae]
MLAMVGFTACDKDDETSDDGRVQLLSFGPTGAKHGDTLRFFGNNLNLVTEVTFTGNNAVVKQTEFKQQTAQEILLVVPQAAEQGVVTLKSAQGDVVSKTQFNLNVTTQVTGVTAEARPGTDITLSGSYLNWVKSISFAKGKVVTSFVSKAFDKLVVKVPADAETGPLVIAYSGTDSAEFETADTVRVILPVATGFAPSPVKHADNLTINGTDLDLTEKVGFTGVATPITEFVSKTATQLVVKVPAGAQKGKVTLMPASGVASVSAMDMEVLLPAITGFAPSPVDPNTNLTINGTNLDLVTSVTFQNAAPVTAFVSQSASRLVVRVPNGVLRGKVVLGVRNSSLTVESGDVLEITGAVPPPTLAFPIYTDAVTANWTGNSGWIGGGWGGNKNYDNTTPVREGSKSVKIDYVGGYGSPVQLGGTNISLAQYRNFKLSVFGAPGSGGKTITVGINGTNGKFNITVVEGKWTDYSVPLTTLTSDAALKEIWVQEFSGTGGFSVYVDALGLD